VFGKAPRGATQRAPVKEKDQQDKLIPTWLWMIFGVLLGLSLAVLLYLWQPWQPANRPIDATQPSANSNNTPDDNETNKEYEFYDLLPKQQVTPVPNEAVPSTTTTQPNDHIIISPAPVVTPEQNTAHADPAEIANKPAAPQYMLQVNSYKNPDDADARRAEILLVGLPADVRQNTLADGTVWFRIVSGPFSSKAEALNAQHLLQDSGIDSLVVEQR
jgi:cell division protein FtsN